jgi:hypothetical protein
MKKVAKLALFAGLVAAPLSLRAADLVLFSPTGQPVAVVQMPSEAVMLPSPIDFPAAGLFAQQDAMIRRMMDDVHALATASPFGDNGLESAFAPQFAPVVAGAGSPGSMVMISSFTDGRTSCSRTVSYQARPNAAPLVQVSQTGSACAALPAAGSAPITVSEPDQPRPPPLEQPRLAPHPMGSAGPQLYRIDYRHPVAAAHADRG